MLNGEEELSSVFYIKICLIHDKIFNIPSIDENDYNTKKIKIIKLIISIFSDEKKLEGRIPPG